MIALAQASIDAKLENLSIDAPAPKLVKLLEKYIYGLEFNFENVQGELQSNMVSLILPNDMWYIKVRILTKAIVEFFSYIENIS